MHQSPQKQLGGFRRVKSAALEAFEDAGAERRLQRGSHPKARKFPLREDSPREKRASREHPRG